MKDDCDWTLREWFVVLSGITAYAICATIASLANRFRDE